MPKEYVYNKLEAPESAVKVVWQREENGGYIQVATFKNGDFKDEHENAQYVDLDRRQVNLLIRHLRRARDQAYGRDE